MQSLRIDALRRMLESRPGDLRARFGLALEYERLEDWGEVVYHLRLYLAEADDEGNAYGRLARALRNLGEVEESIEAYRQGIAAAERHGHPTLAGELQDELDSF